MKTKDFAARLTDGVGSICYAPPRLSEVIALVHRFGVFELDTAAGELRRKGRLVPLQEQPLLVLAALLERSGEIVSRVELRRRLWPPDVHVDFDNGINAAVGRLREALGDPASSPRFVDTVPRRGYRFIAPVEPAPEEAPPPWWRTGAVVGAAKLAALLAASLALWATVDAVWKVRRPPPPPPFSPVVKIAVLPFVNLGTDPGKEFLGDALAEELIAILGRLRPESLRVIARTSVMTYKETDAGVGEIGRQLGVGFVLEGSVRQEGDAVRVTTALVEVASQTQLWSSTFDRTLGSLMAVEREIASEVAGALALELLPASPASEANGRAHELSLEGRYFLGQLTEDGFKKAFRAFEAALVEEPRSAAAHAGLAEAWILLGLYDFVAGDEAARRAGAAARRALELDPASAEGHLALGAVRYLYEWDFAAAGEALEQALALHPGLVEAHLFAADYYTSVGRHDAAVAAAERALELDPLSLAVHSQGCWQLFVARREEEGIARCRRALELDPDFLVAWDVLKWIHIRRGDEEEAVQAFLRVVELEELHADSIAKLREVAAKGGLAGLIRESLGSPEERVRESGQSPYNIVLDYAALGEVDAALDWLERSFEERETDLVNLAVDPRLDVLRGDVRFREMLRRVGLPRAD